MKKLVYIDAQFTLRIVDLSLQPEIRHVAHHQLLRGPVYIAQNRI